jgi:hypothetical protein
MNAAATGEDVVWWDGVPYPLLVERFEPVERREGDWVASGPGWALRFAVAAVRSADERLVLLRSRYVQPIGRFEGTLPAPAGATAAVRLSGVTEDHQARW